jgi:16S rRNA (adenine1518-N6/adenine1519-N6)-dimethyltransferase
MQQPPQTPADIRALLKGLGLRPQKGFGQNFLTSEAVLQRIVAAGEPSATDTVVEVGPGLGHLTRRLAEQAGRVIAVEIDRGLAQRLRETFRDVPNVEIVERDILRVEPGDLVDGQPYKVIANLPYYISSAAFRHFLEEAQQRPTRLVVMVQREVGERILAPAGDLNLLAIGIQVFGKPRPVTRVPPNAFYPQPRVESMVLRIDVYDRPVIQSPPETFFKVVSAGFAMPRKQLHNSLAQRLWMPPSAAPELLRGVGIDPTRRPQTLSIAEWDRLTAEMRGQGIV